MAQIDFSKMPDFAGREKEWLHVRFTRPKGHFFPIYSWLIILIEWWWGGASHVQLWWESEYWDEKLVYEASGTHVKYVGQEFVDQNDPWVIVYEFRVLLSPEARWKTLKWCQRHANIKYAITEVLGFVPVRIAYLFGKRIKNPWGDGTETQFCSEMIGFLMRDIWGREDGIGDFSIQEDLDVAGPKLIFQYFLEAARNSQFVERLK